MMTITLTILQVTSSLAALFDPFDQQSNQLLPSEIRRKEPESVCDGNSICSFLQANNHGVNVVEYCKCEGPVRCSVQWDPYDGKSITQSQSDQYKYCQFAPPVKKCSSTTEVAYTSLQIFHGEVKVQSRDQVHCVCPDGHNYLDSKYDFRESEDITEVFVDYYCIPLQRCNATEYCKDVTVKPGEYIVNPKCLCQEGLACPSVTRKGVEKILLGHNMELQRIKCQDPISGTGRFTELYGAQRLTKLYRKRWANKKRLMGTKRSGSDFRTPRLDMIRNN